MFRSAGKDIMTIQEAMQIEIDFYGIQSPSEEDVFRFTESMDYLIHETKQPRYIMGLGSYYYEQKRFDLALKYYFMDAGKLLVAKIKHIEKRGLSQRNGLEYT